MPATIDIPFSHRHDLGEAPHWDAPTRTLIYVDIFNGLVHDLDPATGALTTVAVEAPVGFVVPVAGSTERIAACGGSLVRMTPAGIELGRLAVEAHLTGHRVNDGKADPVGRLWFGTMAKDWAKGVSGMYCVDEHGLRQVASGITLSNGLDWDVSRRRMYYVDSPTQQIDVFDYDVATGAVENRRRFAAVPAEDGLPDGLCLDAEGCVWLCLFGGGKIRRFDPDGAVMSDLAVPVTHPTCPVFGGDDLRTLYVTTSRHKLTPEQRETQTLAGSLLVIDAGVPGRPCDEVDPAVAALISGR